MARYKPVEWFDDAGPEAAPAIVFVHGMRLTRKMWLPQMEALGGDYRVIAVDLPGHGTLAGTRFEMEAAVRIVAQVIDEAAGGRALLVGSSLGGYVSLEVAGRHPEKVAGLVLSGCTLNVGGMIALYFQIGTRLLARLDERWLIWSHEKLCRRMFPPSMAEPIIEAGFYFDAVPEALGALLGQNFLPRLQAYPGPVLFLNGQRDLIFRRHEAAFLAAAPNGRLQLIRWGSHRCSLEKPQAFTEGVRRFAQSIGW